MTHEATRLAELRDAFRTADTLHILSPSNVSRHDRTTAREKAWAELSSAIDALAALAQPAPTAEVALPAVSKEIRNLGYELDGVIIDAEQGSGFDAVCLRTVKRVRNRIAELARAQSAAKGDEGGSQ